MFLPRNRNIVDLVPVDDPKGLTKMDWFATDGSFHDGELTPWQWGCAEIYLTIGIHYDGRFLIVDGGNYLRHEAGRGRSKGNYRTFKNAAEAAAFAEKYDGPMPYSDWCRAREAADA